jgi:pyruvate dehydrogenase (quinone)
MVSALSQAIGSQATYRNRQVVAMCGDGGFAMLMGYFITLTQVGLPIKVVIFNNGTLRFVQLEMKAAGFLDVGTDLHNPNFASMAKAMGVYSVRIEDPGEVGDGLQQAFAYSGPALIDVVTNRMELSIPPKITAEQVKGFSLYVIRAIMNGRGNEVFELVKSNLWR